MRIDDIRQRLRAHGAKPCHEDKILRLWSQALPMDSGKRRPEDFLPLDVPASINAFGRAPDLTLTQPVTFARADAPPLWLGHGTADTVVHDEDTVILNQRMQDVGGRSEAKLYPGLDHADLIATFSPVFRKKAPVLDDVSAFLHRELGN